jgi:hypothetical protein
VTEWNPPVRLALEWRNVNFSPTEKTFVTVSFDASPSGTLVTVTHSGWSAIRADHPVRHGLDAPAFIRNCQPCVEYQGCTPGYPMVWCPTVGSVPLHNNQEPITTVGLWHFIQRF